MEDLLIQSRKILLLFLIITHCIQAYTYEPPGRDPVSIDRIRSSEKAIHLTAENFDELTSGKIIFLKFYAPNCPHCKSIASAWSDLASYYDKEDINHVLIGSIDCTDSPHGKKLCGRFKIVGLPTLLYGDASFGGIYLEEYGGDKSYESLKQFALKELVPKCLPLSMDVCSSEERPKIESYITMSHQELLDSIKGLEQKILDLRSSFEINFKVLQKEHDQKLLKKELMITRSKKIVKLIKGVINEKSVRRVNNDLKIVGG